MSAKFFKMNFTNQFALVRVWRGFIGDILPLREEIHYDNEISNSESEISTGRSFFQCTHEIFLESVNSAYRATCADVHMPI